MDKDYKITNVQSREPWTGTYGTFNAFALLLEGVDGWVEISQKQDTPAPQVGATIFGHMETSKSKDGSKTYIKFKKAKNPAYGGGNSGGVNQADIDYMIMMLEEVTLRRESPETPTPRGMVSKDVILTDIEGTEEIDLSTIPF